MYTFFRDWRRKFGCVMLVMACAVMGLWMRSRVVLDRVDFDLGHHWHRFSSYDGGLAWHSVDMDLLCFSTPRIDHAAPQWQSSHLDLEKISLMRRFESPQISCLTIVIPLTLLSAYLILWKPRKRGVS